MKPTEQQLQIGLVMALPEQLTSREYSDSFGPLICWKGLRCNYVTEHEWPAIVGMVFRQWLEQGQRDFGQYRYFSLVANWQEAAEYLVEIGAITIEGQL